MNTRLTSCVLLVLLAIGSLLWFGPQAVAYPKPALIGQSWELTFDFKPPRTIAVPDMDGQVRWYWYMPYTVTNNTDTEQFFVPQVTVATDQGDILTAGRGIGPNVFRAIQKQLGNPLLDNPIQVSGRILIGEDHAKESVAIWPVFPHDVDEMRMFIAGLSGETQKVKHPLTGKDIELRKSKMLIFQTPGTSVHPQRQPIQIHTQTWVMR